MITKAQKKWMLGAIGVFLVTSLLAIIVNSLSHGWHFGYSISRYVGLETWSAVVFALGNIVVAGLFGRYLYVVGKAWRMPKWFYILVIVVIVALLGLSACPIGYFDLPGTEYGSSWSSQIHQVCSRLMFACMLAMAFAWQWCSAAKDSSRRWCAVFVVYGVFCAVAYLLKLDWFFRATLVFESTYILGFMVLSLGLQGQNVVKERTKDGRAEAEN